MRVQVRIVPHHICRRVKGLKGKAAWRYSRSTSASSVGSVGSLEVNPPSSCNSNNSSPQHSRSPSPIPILGNNVSSMRNKSMSPTGNCERDSLIVEPDSDAGGSRSAPPTPVMQDHNMLLSSPTTCSNGESSLDFSPPNQRRYALKSQDQFLYSILSESSKICLHKLQIVSGN